MQPLVWLFIKKLRLVKDLHRFGRWSHLQLNSAGSGQNETTKKTWVDFLNVQHADTCTNTTYADGETKGLRPRKWHSSKTLALFGVQGGDTQNLRSWRLPIYLLLCIALHYHQIVTVKGKTSLFRIKTQYLQEIWLCPKNLKTEPTPLRESQSIILLLYLYVSD